MLFSLQELFSQFPAVNLRLFRLPAFRWLCVSEFLNTLGLFGAQFMIPIFLQQVMGYTPLQAGLIIVPALLVAAVGGTVVGRLTDLVSPRLLILLALGLLTGVFQLFSTVSALTTSGVLIGYIVLYRVCLFSIQTPVTALNMQMLGPDQIRMGQGLLGTVRNVAAAVGVTVTSVIFERRRTAHQLQAYLEYNVASPEHHSVVREVERWLGDAGIAATDIPGMTLRALRQQIDVESVAAGFRDSFFVISFCFLLAMLPLLCIPALRARQR